MKKQPVAPVSSASSRSPKGKRSAQAANDNGPLSMRRPKVDAFAGAGESFKRFLCQETLDPVPDGIESIANVLWLLAHASEGAEVDRIPDHMLVTELLRAQTKLLVLAELVRAEHSVLRNSSE